MKWTLALAFFGLLMQLSSVQGKPADDKDNIDDDYYAGDQDDYNYSEDENYTFNGEKIRDEEIDFQPKFVTKSSTFTFNRGTTINLPCKVDKLPTNFVLFWKKISQDGREEIVAVDKIVSKDRAAVEVTHTGREPGSNLIISLAEDEDSGTYICEMATSKDKLKTVKHTVNVRAPPKITKSPTNGLVLARKGDTVSLSCIGHGSPEPTITWSRVGKRMPDNSESIEGNELVFQEVSREHGGVYVCKADNGFGTEVSEKLNVHVEYKPEVEVQEIFIHAKAGNKVELVCTVHSNPGATIHWFKNDDMTLTNETASMTEHGNKHILTIPNVREEDFGNYTCRAKNKHGEESKVLEISGLAAFPSFVSNKAGYEPNQYLIEWTVKSYTEITKFSLKVRQLGESQWETFEITPSRIDPSFMYAGKHSLTGLEAATRYQAMVSSLNDKGWSRSSPIFNFATFGAEPITDESTSGAQSLKTFLVTLVTTLVSIMLTKCL